MVTELLYYQQNSRKSLAKYTKDIKESRGVTSEPNILCGGQKSKHNWRNISRAAQNVSRTTFLQGNLCYLHHCLTTHGKTRVVLVRYWDLYCSCTRKVAGSLCSLRRDISRGTHHVPKSSRPSAPFSVQWFKGQIKYLEKAWERGYSMPPAVLNMSWVGTDRSYPHVLIYTCSSSPGH